MKARSIVITRGFFMATSALGIRDYPSGDGEARRSLGFDERQALAHEAHALARGKPHVAGLALLRDPQVARLAGDYQPAGCMELQELARREIHSACFPWTAAWRATKSCESVP
jgi:hypothetical protein